VIRAGWSLQTNWFANLQACPAVNVQLGGQGFTPQQRFLADSHDRRNTRGASGLAMPSAAMLHR
jgi:hypothetical protein